jgi:LacI family gluconate utilization system Gnt-I transcriptional repressor
MGRKRTRSGKIRLAEVAKLAGVSPITASRFFRNPEALSVSKRERVDSAVKELGYVPNLAARALASHRTEVIGVVIPSLTNNVFADVLRGVYDSSEGSRYSIQLANTRYSILQEEKLLHLFRAQKPAGLIVTGINQTAESRAILESMNCPVAQIMEIDNNPVDMMVGFSHYDAGFAAITHMLEQGFRRIGFLGARMDPRVQRRFEGYRDAMKTASLCDRTSSSRLPCRPPSRLAGRCSPISWRGRRISMRCSASTTTSLWASCSNASAARYRFPARSPLSASTIWNSWRPPSLP